jgi:hypothetical protein
LESCIREKATFFGRVSSLVEPRRKRRKGKDVNTAGNEEGCLWARRGKEGLENAREAGVRM